MAKRDRNTYQTKIDKWIKAGRGQGRGTDYQPWLTVQDVASQGLATRIQGHKTKRIHHFFSSLETDFFCVLELSPEVVDIREQFPLLPLEETLEIAKACGVRHPTDPASREPIVMTTDVVITWLRPQPVDIARTLKLSQQLESVRTLEKLEIERRYWHSRQGQGQGTDTGDWGIVTEREMPPVLVQSCRLLREYLEPSTALQPDEANVLTQVLTDKVHHSQAPLRIVALACDRQLGFSPGTSLALAYHLIATRYWEIDWQQPLDPGKPLALLGTDTAPDTGGQA